MFAVQMERRAEGGQQLGDDDDLGPILLRLCLYFH